MEKSPKDYGMSDERYFQLMAEDNLSLTQEEVDKGWHFCHEWDGLLINENDDDCSCKKLHKK